MGGDDDTVRSGSRLGRRAFVSGLGATAAAGIGSKYLGSPLGSAAAVDWQKVGIAATTVVGGPIALLAYGASVGSSNEDAVADSLDYQAHVDEFTRYREEGLSQEQTLASVERDVQLVENKAREEAIFAIYEQAVDSGTESDATAAAEAAIDDAYAVVERAILDSFSIRVNRFHNVAQSLLPGTDSQYYGSRHIGNRLYDDLGASSSTEVVRPTEL
ncbi:hypothetical protein CK500_01145 [Halorubrum salipaludis]|uniref:Envelope protein N-terminal domain-containing protein n=1 Tax=Halorubrum salipaludis TaxID=2032630 RepID=A0A2A2FKL7_9EURY|nr:hypothetical protein [Halorubrum salipaludis]PAU85304.1 hypothetical protein CK500_01145 [Halorubrum salipaludis]